MPIADPFIQSINAMVGLLDEHEKEKHSILDKMNSVYEEMATMHETHKPLHRELFVSLWAQLVSFEDQQQKTHLNAIGKAIEKQGWFDQQDNALFSQALSLLNQPFSKEKKYQRLTEYRKACEDDYIEAATDEDDGSFFIDIDAWSQQLKREANEHDLEAENPVEDLVLLGNFSIDTLTSKMMNACGQNVLQKLKEITNRSALHSSDDSPQYLTKLQNKIHPHFSDWDQISLQITYTMAKKFRALQPLDKLMSSEDMPEERIENCFEEMRLDLEKLYPEKTSENQYLQREYQEYYGKKGSEGLKDKLSALQNKILQTKKDEKNPEKRRIAINHSLRKFQREVYFQLANNYRTHQVQISPYQMNNPIKYNQAATNVYQDLVSTIEKHTFSTAQVTDEQLMRGNTVRGILRSSSAKNHKNLLFSHYLLREKGKLGFGPLHQEGDPMHPEKPYDFYEASQHNHLNRVRARYDQMRIHVQDTRNGLHRTKVKREHAYILINKIRNQLLDSMNKGQYVSPETQQALFESADGTQAFEKQMQGLGQEIRLHKKTKYTRYRASDHRFDNLKAKFRNLKQNVNKLNTLIQELKGKGTLSEEEISEIEAFDKCFKNGETEKAYTIINGYIPKHIGHELGRSSRLYQEWKRSWKTESEITNKTRDCLAFFEDANEPEPEREAKIEPRSKGAVFFPAPSVTKTLQENLEAEPPMLDEFAFAQKQMELNAEKSRAEHLLAEPATRSLFMEKKSNETVAMPAELVRRYEFDGYVQPQVEAANKSGDAATALLDFGHAFMFFITDHMMARKPFLSTAFYAVPYAQFGAAGLAAVHCCPHLMNAVGAKMAAIESKMTLGLIPKAGIMQATDAASKGLLWFSHGHGTFEALVLCGFAMGKATFTLADGISSAWMKDEKNESLIAEVRNKMVRGQMTGHEDTQEKILNAATSSVKMLLTATAVVALGLGASIAHITPISMLANIPKELILHPGIPTLGAIKTASLFLGKLMAVDYFIEQGLILSGDGTLLNKNSEQYQVLKLFTRLCVDEDFRKKYENKMNSQEFEHLRFEFERILSVNPRLSKVFPVEELDKLGVQQIQSSVSRRFTYSFAQAGINLLGNLTVVPLIIGVSRWIYNAFKGNETSPALKRFCLFMPQMLLKLARLGVEVFRAFLTSSAKVAARSPQIIFGAILFSFEALFRGVSWIFRLFKKNKINEKIASKSVLAEEEQEVNQAEFRAIVEPDGAFEENELIDIPLGEENTYATQEEFQQERNRAEEIDALTECVMENTTGSGARDAASRTQSRKQSEPIFKWTRGLCSWLNKEFTDPLERGANRIMNQVKEQVVYRIDDFVQEKMHGRKTLERLGDAVYSSTVSRHALEDLLNRFKTTVGLSEKDKLTRNRLERFLNHAKHLDKFSSLLLLRTLFREERVKLDKSGDDGEAQLITLRRSMQHYMSESKITNATQALPLGLSNCHTVPEGLSGCQQFDRWPVVVSGDRDKPMNRDDMSGPTPVWV